MRGVHLSVRNSRWLAITTALFLNNRIFNSIASNFISCYFHTELLLLWIGGTMMLGNSPSTLHRCIGTLAGDLDLRPLRMQQDGGEGRDPDPRDPVGVIVCCGLGPVFTFCILLFVHPCEGATLYVHYSTSFH